MKTLAGATVRSGARILGVDRTRRSLTQPCVVVAPHPDDETLGCAAAIMRRRDAGTDVTVMVASDGAESTPGADRLALVATRSAELHRACRLLGVDPDEVIELGFPDAKLEAMGEELVSAIADIVRSRRPAVVLSTSPGDPHPDHAAVGRAAAKALAGTSARLLSYPIWQWDRPRTWPATVAGMASRRPELVRIGSYLDRKREVISTYATQLDVAAGGSHPAGMQPGFLRHFVGSHELFLPMATLRR